ncbi:radical SAM protein [bacterium]|nr:radical SAM protein [bacterium]RQV98548.1 MAG: radical SAM protein [bacterium]
MIDKLSKIALIQKRLKKAYAFLTSCRLCPRACGVNRLKGETGFCGAGFHPVVSSDNLHFGEEPPISGYHGSGTIFLTGCNLGCVFCQNYPISHLGHGNRVKLPRLATMMLRLQKAGAHNINFVTPTHFAPQILGALLIAYQKGLSIPIVYNCGGYESVEMLKLWDGIVDIYMPDMKYSDSAVSEKYASAPDYPEVNREAAKEMFRQVGDLQIDQNNIAISGLLIRHLVLPEDISGTGNILRFITEEISKRTYVSLMSQYFPAYKALSMPPLDRRITHDEYAKAKENLSYWGLERGWTQG